MHHGDTVFVERLQIAADGTSVRYIVNVEHHPAPVKFVLVNSDQNKWVFENPLHDFPNTIAYIREGPAHMTCVIEGNGRSRAFHFEKVE